SPILGHCRDTAAGKPTTTPEDQHHGHQDRIAPHPELSAVAATALSAGNPARAMTTTGASKMTANIRAMTLAVLLSIPALPVFASVSTIMLPLNDASAVRPRNVMVNAVAYRGSDALEIRQTGPTRGFDVDSFAFVPDLDFHDGTIDVDVAGSLLPTALTGAR